MQIGALGFVNSARSQIDVGQANTSQNSGFARLTFRFDRGCKGW